MLHAIRRTDVHLNPKVYIPLFQSKLDCMWNVGDLARTPHLRRDADKLTRMMSRFCQVSNEERLAHLMVFPFQSHHFMITTFCIGNGLATWSQHSSVGSYHPIMVQLRCLLQFLVHRKF